ncbi:ribonuclease HII [Striga asiatica]|uniref:Ribonuclease HII n=1 Tax=Striga asiatica TaxID=4170 RepID=A0A5A7P4E1_STRAF|nr:ribonuclease HII [Striga asiatica]
MASISPEKLISTNNIERHKSNLSSLVGGEGILGSLLPLGSGLELRQVTMIVALHLQVEDLGVAAGGRSNEFGVEEPEDAVADVGELRLDLGSVTLDGGHVALVTAALLLLLDGGDDPPGGAAGAYDVLVGDGEEVALLHGELVAVNGADDLLHELHHLLVSLRLLRQLGHVHVLLAWGRHSDLCRRDFEFFFFSREKGRRLGIFFAFLERESGRQGLRNEC